MAERKSAPRKVDVDTSGDPHKRRERMIRWAMFVGAVLIVAGMVFLAKFLSGQQG